LSDNVQIEFGPEVSRVLRVFKGLSDATKAGIVAGATRGLLLAETRVRTRSGVKFSGAGKGLSNRLTSYARVHDDDIDGAIGFRKTRQFDYVLSQEFGAKAKAGKAMVVPISPEAKAASMRGVGPRERGIELALVKSVGGKPLLISRVGRKVSIEYLLIKSLKPKLKFRENVAASVPDLEREIFNGFAGGVARA